MSEETAVEVTPELSMSQRIQANEVIAADINKAGNGLRAEVWTSTGANVGTGISVFDGDTKFAIATVNGKGYIKLRNYLSGTKPSVLAKLADFGIEADTFTEKVSEYKQGGGTKFNLARLAKS